MTMELFIALAAGYFFGSVPFGLIFTKLAGLGDVREIGSRSIGATNVMRMGGFKLAFLTFLFDLLKAAAAGWLFGVWAGLAAVIGHNYSVWLRFRGGKGFSASGGFLLAVSPIAFSTCFVIWLIIALSFGYSSLAALVLLSIAPIFGFAVSNAAGWATILLAVIGFWRHRENIERLLSGTESKINWKKK